MAEGSYDLESNNNKVEIISVGLAAKGLILYEKLSLKLSKHHSLVKIGEF